MIISRARLCPHRAASLWQAATSHLIASHLISSISSRLVASPRSSRSFARARTAKHSHPAPTECRRCGSSRDCSSRRPMNLALQAPEVGRHTYLCISCAGRAGSRCARKSTCHSSTIAAQAKRSKTRRLGAGSRDARNVDFWLTPLARSSLMRRPSLAGTAGAIIISIGTGIIIASR